MISEAIASCLPDLLTNDPQKAIDLCRISLKDQLDRNNGSENFLTSEILIQMGRSYLAISENGMAQFLFNRALSIPDVGKQMAELACDYCALAYWRENNYYQALIWMERAIKYSEVDADKPEQLPQISVDPEIPELYYKMPFQILADHCSWLRLCTPTDFFERGLRLARSCYPSNDFLVARLAVNLADLISEPRSKELMEEARSLIERIENPSEDIKEFMNCNFNINDYCNSLRIYLCSVTNNKESELFSTKDYYEVPLEAECIRLTHWSGDRKINCDLFIDPSRLVAKPDELLKISIEENLNWNTVNLNGRPIILIADKTEQILNLSEMENFSELRVCIIENVEIPDLKFMDQINSLNYLKLKKCRALKNLRFLNKHKSLKKVWLTELDCPELTDFSPLGDLTALETLSLRSNRGLKQLPALERLQSLESLNLEGCCSLVDISGLKNLKNLTYLDLENCPELADLSALVDLTALKTLDLKNNRGLKQLPPLERLLSLESIHLEGCSSLVDISGLKNLKSLTRLKIINCNPNIKLPNIPGLKVEVESDD